ncbi:MAG: 3-deoxy-manno-octulosonate cytidylyltransferase [Aestuariivita sp.]|nr:3-deoxy-manno-octulosonate cytidylyltransferase [Aestuariivita sp.]
MSVLIIIPARYASSRYPGKPLVHLVGADGKGRSLIERSWRAAHSVFGVDRIVVATDDVRIRALAHNFGAEVVMTSSECANGTERCAEAHDLLNENYEIIVNFQGDAPLTPHWFVEALIKRLRSVSEGVVATPVLRCNGTMLEELRADRLAGRMGSTTVVFDRMNRAMYFSKEVIPYTDNRYSDRIKAPVFHHVGIYAYRAAVLEQYLSWPVGRLESNESLEQLRFIENGQSVICVEVDSQGRLFWELNNPEDKPKIEKMLEKMGWE